MAKYPIFLELGGRRAVVIGGGAVAVRKAQSLLAAGARLVVVAERIDDLVAEHKHQCPKVYELLNGFRGANRLMTREELFKWINNRISEHMEPIIEGKRTRSPMVIAHFLYRLGFIVARSDNANGNYEHYRFDQMPDFLTSRTDEDFGLKWEIHPCYREALDITKLDRSHRQRFRRLRGNY